LAGSLRFLGAAVLCSKAAMRSGAGLVTLGIAQSLSNATLKIKSPEVMLLPLAQTKEATISLSAYKKVRNFIKTIDVAVIGPGLTQNKSTQDLVRKLILHVNKPMVIDADGLNALVGHLDILSSVILTPHPGEMARLLGITVKEVERDRKNIAKKFAIDYNVTLVLKGHNTIVADQQGNFYINKTGNPGMSTAGSGDVLAGIIAAFLGQGLDSFSASKYAVYLHGLAGDLAAKDKTQAGMIASDIIDNIPEAIKKCS